MTPNPGFQPDETRGKRVKVVLANGRRPIEAWPADTTVWRHRDHPFDVAQWELA